MKKKLLFRLCLPLLVVVTAYSCRTDQLPEQETYYNNKAKFQLTSKRISLDESKHKKLLLSELEKSKTNLQKLKLDIAGKVIDYGNGVSIDTDDVIYIENGPNYHTYTFHITRENALPNDPVENLVLTPLKDGTYRELFVSYNFTPQEKEMVRNGGFVDAKGKTVVTELAIGTYSPLSKGSSCGWEEETVWVSCSSGDHHQGNIGEWVECIADVKPRAYVTYTYKCEFLEDINNPTPGSPSIPYENPGGPSDGGGVPGTGTGDCDSPGVLTEPQDPSSGIGEGGCDIGVPSLPNLPNPKNAPCEKIKTQRADTDFNSKITDLQGKTGLTKETGYIQKWGGDYEYKDNAGATDDANTLSLPNVANNTWIKAYMHTHIDDKPNSDTKGIKMFSPADVVYFMDLIQNAQTQGHSLSDVYAVMVTSTGNYQIRFTGNMYQIKTFNEDQKKSHNEPFGIFMADYMINSKKLELGFLKYIQKEMLLYGITLYRMNSDGTTTEIKLNADKTDTVENTCP